VGFVAIGGKGIIKKSIDKETFRKIAEYLGISKADFDRLMENNPTSIYIHRAPDAAKTGGSHGSGSGSGGSGSA
jgi:hypothetical protein